MRVEIGPELLERECVYQVAKSLGLSLDIKKDTAGELHRLISVRLYRSRDECRFIVRVDGEEGCGTIVCRVDDALKPLDDFYNEFIEPIMPSLTGRVMSRSKLVRDVVAGQAVLLAN